MRAPVVAAALALVLSAGSPASPAGDAPTSHFRLLRSTSGTSGRQSGTRYVIDDPRREFYAADDKQVVVYFEWQGPAGTHHVACTWKNPEGKSVSMASLDQTAPDGRFGAYWTMPLAKDTRPGLWALEAAVDGEPAGIHTLQILAGSSTGASTAAPRKLRTAAEIYSLAGAAIVSIEKQGPDGKAVAQGSGFFVGDGLVLTTFHLIDGAQALEITGADGHKGAVAAVAGWSRTQDWALLKTSVAGSALQRAPERSWAVGDRCFALDVTPEGRVLSDLAIAGRMDNKAAGDRMILNGGVSDRAWGGPLLNEYGEVIALTGVEAALVSAPNVLTRVVRRFGLPIEIVPADAPASSATLADLSAAGAFLPLVTAGRHIFQASFGHQTKGPGGAPSLTDQGTSFARRDGAIILWVMWEPKQKLKTTYLLRFYNLDNKLVGASKPSKLDIPPGPYSYTYWTLPVETFPAATYRVDVVLGTEIAWRGYLQVTD